MALQKASNTGATPFKFVNSGDTLKGYYQGQVEKTINGSPAIEHTYRTKQGIVSVLGQANILVQYRNNGITPGTYVEITFSGDVQKLKGGRTMKVYNVSFDLDDRDGNAAAPSDIATLDDGDDDHSWAASTTAQKAPLAAVAASKQAEIQALLKARR